MFNSRLRQRITLYFLLIFLVPTVILVLMAYQSGSKTLQNTASKQLESIITLKEQSINNWIKEEKQLIEVLVEIPIVQERSEILLSSVSSNADRAAAYASLSKYLKRVQSRMPDLLELSILNTVGGRTVLSTNPKEEGRYHLSDSFFTSGKEKTYVQRIFYSKIYNHPMTMVATPIKDRKGNNVGVLFAHVHPSHFMRIASESEGLGETGETYFVDIYHRMVTKSRFDDSITLEEVNSAGINSALERVNISGRYTNYRGEEVIGFYRWLEEPRVVLVAEISLEEALSPLFNFAQVLVLAAIIIAVITAGFAFFFARQITTPIVNLSQAAVRVSEGDFSQKSEVQTSDELQDLSGAFNRMTDQLSDLYNNLEHKVEERTRRLETVASIGEFFTSILDVEKLTHELTNVLREKFGYVDVAVFLLSADRQWLEPKFRSRELEEIESIPINQDGVVPRAARENEIILNETVTLSDSKEAANAAEKEIAIPITLGENNLVIGAIYVTTPLGYSLDDGDTNMLRTMASQIAVAINNAQIFQHIEQAKREWEVTFGAMNDGIVIVAPDMSVLRENREFSTIFHREPSKDVVIPLIDEIVVGLDTDDSRKCIGETFSSMTPHQCVYSFSERIFEARTFPVIESNDDGDKFVSKVVLVLHDITEKTKADEALKQSAELLQSKNKELQEFAYIASHDLQEPLRKIQAFGDRLVSKYAENIPEQGIEFVNRMRNASSRMQTLINGLLDYSRVTTNASDFTSVDLDQVAREVMSDLEIRIEELHGQVIIEGLPKIDADALQMRQLIQNLVGNALKFHKEDEPPVVRLTARMMSAGIDDENYAENTQLCEITVSDNGIGFEEQYRDKVFGVFQRLVGKSQYEGSGIGLSICRKIIERHNGTIDVQSKVDVGTTFTITLPLAHQATKSQEAA